MNEAIEVGTLNLWGRKGHFDLRMNNLIREIESAAFHIVCLQEVLVLDGHHPLLRHLGRKGYNVHFAPTIRDGEQYLYGNAIAARIPRMRAEAISLPTSACQEPRNAIIAKFKLDATYVRVVATHLTNGNSEAEQRFLQITHILESVRTLDQIEQYPWLIAGDLNAAPTEDKVHGQLGADGFEDAHRDRDEHIRHTQLIEHNPNSNIRGIVDKLDYIYFQKERIKCASSDYFAALPTDGQYISDHVGVSAIFLI